MCVCACMWVHVNIHVCICERVVLQVRVIKVAV